MAFDYQIFPDERCIAFRMHGVYSIEDCRTATRSAMADPAFSPDFAQITDLTGITRFDADYAQVSTLASFIADSAVDIEPGTLFVILATRDINYGMARMFQQLIEGRTPFSVSLVRSRTEAARVLALSTQTVDRMLADAP
ncbi:hypothetical protein [Tropicibacter oceani]|uniref:HTH crp-type domain-containing protein n=1 Tax=Tropicibacter oceani TaxID=3058420 RepID=A0ABY8QG95_9RHOB|nr:hypothetical protein [Tropicibacter oceani]WGW03021.1 hypothetical protein QF118_13915 [Tropicibacter oceani]